MSASNYVGQLIQCPESSIPNAVYLVFPEGASWIPNTGVGNALFGANNNWQSRIQQISLGEFNTIPIIEPLTIYARLASGNPAKPNAIYLVTGEVKRHIMSPEVMHKYDFDWNSVKQRQSSLFAVPDGVNITT